MQLREWFSGFAQRASHALGSPWVFGLSSLGMLLWVLGGLVVGYSEMYQLVLNTITTILMFLFVIIIQHTQIRESTAAAVKLDELITALARADNRLVGLEQASLPEIEQTQASKHPSARPGAEPRA